MGKKITDEMKRFISTQHAEGKDRTEILREFGDRFGFLPTSPTIGKYEKFNEDHPIVEEEEEEESGEGKIGAKIKDSRLEKGLLDFSDGIEEEEVKRLARNIDKTPRDTWDLLAEATRRGYTKVNMATGEIEK